MDLLEQAPADLQTWLAPGERFIDSHKRVENFSFARGQRIKSRLQTLLQIFQDQRNEADIGDFVFRERVAHVFRTQRAQMHYCRAARERPEKSDHEIDGMI